MRHIGQQGTGVLRQAAEFQPKLTGFPSIQLAVTQLLYSEFPRLSGTLKTPARAGEQDETAHKIHVSTFIEKCDASKCR